MMYLDTVRCPYCGFKNDMSDGCVDLPEDNKFDHKCENCEEEFEVEVEFNPTYYANKIIYEGCQHCKKITREIYKKGKVNPYPKNTEETKLCWYCWRELIKEELWKE